MTTYLNAHVSRRQQLLALRDAYSTSTHAKLDLRVFSSEPSDRVIVEWDLEALSTHGRRRSDYDEDDDEGVERMIIVQLAFLDLRTDRIDASGGGTILVRYVEKRPGTGESRHFEALSAMSTQSADLIPCTVEEPPTQVMLDELAKRVTSGSRGVEEVIADLVEETTAEGWTANA